MRCLLVLAIVACHASLFRGAHASWIGGLLSSVRAQAPNEAPEHRQLYKEEFQAVHFAELGKVPSHAYVCLEGIFYWDNFFYTSEGVRGASSFLKVNVDDGTVVHETKLAPDVFGEGVAVVRDAQTGRDTFLQLTYKKQIGYKYEEEGSAFRKVGEFSYASKQGWGLTSNGSHLIKTDGTARVQWHEPHNFNVVREITVRSKSGKSVSRLNEIELVQGLLFINVFMQQRIVVVEPATGVIIGEMDLTRLNIGQHMAHSCGPPTANGVAYDAENDRLWLAGKYWTYIYQVRVEFEDGRTMGNGKFVDIHTYAHHDGRKRTALRTGGARVAPSQRLSAADIVRADAARSAPQHTVRAVVARRVAKRTAAEARDDVPMHPTPFPPPPADEVVMHPTPYPPPPAAVDGGDALRIVEHPTPYPPTPPTMIVGAAGLDAAKFWDDGFSDFADAKPRAKTPAPTRAATVAAGAARPPSKPLRGAHTVPHHVSGAHVRHVRRALGWLHLHVIAGVLVCLAGLSVCVNAVRRRARLETSKRYAISQMDSELHFH